MNNNDLKIQKKQSSFDIYRYQLLVSTAIQLKIDGRFNSIEEIRESKNLILENILRNEKFRFFSNKSSIESKLIISEGNILVFRIAVERTAKVYKKDFTEDELENWPNILVVVNNSPNVQKIAIQKNYKAFGNNSTVAALIEESLEPKLKNENIDFYIEPLFDKNEFWRLAEKYTNRIVQVSFDLISPNLANISKNLKIDLRQLNHDTNTQKTKLELNSNKGSNLVLENDSEIIQSLVEYASEGGGNIDIKVKGFRKKFRTNRTVQQISIDEILISSNNLESGVNRFKDLLN